MSDAGYDILKGCLIALLYLFLVRVVLLVARELRGTPVSTLERAPTAEPPPAGAEAPRRKARGWQLVVIEPPHRRGESYPVDGEATIGRGGGCAIALTDDTFVSTVHARAFTRDGNLWVEDLGSTNGTLVGGDHLSEARRLRRGDYVQIGSTVLEARR